MAFSIAIKFTPPSWAGLAHDGLKSYSMKLVPILAILPLLLASCTREECRFPGSYEFVLPAELSPARDTFRIGDTIRVVSSFSDEVFERKTQRAYVLEDFRFHPVTIIHKIDTFPGTGEAGLLDFHVFLHDGTHQYQFISVSGGGALMGQYSYQGGTYSLGYSLVPQRAGLYFLKQLSLLYPTDEWQKFPGKKCKHTDSDARVALNGGADNNIEFLSQSPDPHYHDWVLQDPEGRFHKFGGYCFYVRE
jgi:hypothetical protein